MTGAINGKTRFFGLNLINFDFPRWHQYDWSNWKTIDAVMGTLLPTVRGAWENATSYTIGERVVDIDNGTIWTCNVNHASANTGTFTADRIAHPTYWTAFSSSLPTNRGVWASGVAYNSNDIVNLGYAYYFCLSSHTSNNGGNTTANGALWALIFDATAAVEATSHFNPSDYYTRTVIDTNFLAKLEAALTYAALVGPNAFDTRPTFAGKTPWDSGNFTPEPVAQCRLNWIDVNTIRLDARGGNQITINGTRRTIATPPTLNNTGVAAVAIYYIYAYWDGSAIQLERSATGFTLSNGFPIKTGDPTRTLVGKVLTNASAQFVDITSWRGVLSYWNRLPKNTNYEQIIVLSSMSATALLQVYLFAWQDGLTLRVDMPGYLLGNVAVSPVIYMNYNGNNGSSIQIYTQDASGGGRGFGHGTTFGIPAEGGGPGAYLLTVYGYNNAVANTSIATFLNCLLWG